MAIIINDVFWMKNDYPVEITVAGIKYPSVEHAYQASKFTDEDLKIIISNESIKSAMRIGRSNEITTPSWEDNRIIIMSSLLRQKFSILLNIVLAERLAATGNTEIQGVGLNEFWGLIDESLDDFVGENNLGKILMEIRGEIQFSLGIDTQQFNYSQILLNKLNDNDEFLIGNMVDLFSLLEKEDGNKFSNLDYYLPAVSNCYRKIKSIIDESYFQENSSIEDEKEYDDHSSFDSECDSFDNEYDSFDDDDECECDYCKKTV
jgi:ribA/ribD-fused uncharacterized protein